MPSNTQLNLRKARIEMLPLLDVIFLLLVVFIYTFLCIQAQSTVTVTLPSISGDRSDPPALTTITLKKDGTLLLNGQEIEMKTLSESINKFDTNSAILIEGDTQAELGKGIKLLRTLQESGHTNVAFSVSGEEL